MIVDYIAVMRTEVSTEEDPIAAVYDVVLLVLLLGAARSLQTLGELGLDGVQRLIFDGLHVIGVIVEWRSLGHYFLVGRSSRSCPLCDFSAAGVLEVA